MQLQPNLFHGAAIVTVAGLVLGLALKPALKDPTPEPAAPAASEAAPAQIARTGPTPWWVIGSDALHGRPDPQLTLARVDEAPPPEAAELLDVSPPALAAPPAWSPPREPPRRMAQAEPPRVGGEWREDADGVYFVPEDEAYPREPAYEYDPYA